MVYGVTIDGRNYRFSTLGFSEQIDQLKEEENQLSELDAIRDRQPDHSRNMEEHFQSIDDLFHEYHQKHEPGKDFKEDGFEADLDAESDDFSIDE